MMFKRFILFALVCLFATSAHADFTGPSAGSSGGSVSGAVSILDAGGTNKAAVDSLGALSIKEPYTTANLLSTGSAAPSMMVAIGGVYDTSGSTISSTGYVATPRIDNDAILFTHSSATTHGGASTFFNNAVSTTVVAVKSSAGSLYALTLYNANATIAFCQMWDLATGSVTLGTTPPKLSFFIPAAGGFSQTFGPEGKIAFATAISIACTTTATGSSALTTGVSANAVYQ